MIYLDRFKFDPQGTFGMLTDDTGNLCFTCELPWNDNEPDKSCIPTGLYNVERYSSPKFPQSWQIMNVPGRSGILIHNGNTEVSTHGCILVGDSLGIINGLPGVCNSVNTLNMLQSKLSDSFQLTISGEPT